jgi:hypothetical protein
MSPKAVLTSIDLADQAGFDRRHIPRKAAKGEIPDARRTKTGRHWEFPVTDGLRAWISFYRVRHFLLRKMRSFNEERTLRDWGTNWKIALATYQALRAFPDGVVEKFKLGKECTWEALEFVVLNLGWIVDPDAWVKSTGRLKKLPK